MLLVKDKMIKTIESMPYDLDKEILKRDTMEILQEITQKYVELFGTSDLSESDKDCIKSLIGDKI